MEEYIVDFINDNSEVWFWCGQNIEKMNELMIDVYISYSKHGGGVRKLDLNIYLDVYDITKPKKN